MRRSRQVLCCVIIGFVASSASEKQLGTKTIRDGGAWWCRDLGSALGVGRCACWSGPTATIYIAPCGDFFLDTKTNTTTVACWTGRSTGHEAVQNLPGIHRRFAAHLGLIVLVRRAARWVQIWPEDGDRVVPVLYLAADVWSRAGMVHMVHVGVCMRRRPFAGQARVKPRYRAKPPSSKLHRV